KPGAIRGEGEGAAGRTRRAPLLLRPPKSTSRAPLRPPGRRAPPARTPRPNAAAPRPRPRKSRPPGPPTPRAGPPAGAGAGGLEARPSTVASSSAGGVGVEEAVGRARPGRPPPK